MATHAPFRPSAGPAAGSPPATAVPSVLVAGQLGPRRCRSVPRSDWMNTMWRTAALRLLVRLRLLRRPDLIGRTVARHPVPEELPEGELVLVQDGSRRKWACLRCPGGCGQKIQLALSPNRRPHWRVRLDWLARPSVSPSVRQLNDCRCHFWINRGAVRWCADNGQAVETERASRTPPFARTLVRSRSR